MRVRWKRRRVASMSGVVLALVLALMPTRAEAFCGFFVASAGADLFNETSQVAVVREGERTVMNLAFNYKGEPSQFALVLPVPKVLGEGDVRVVRPELFEKLDAYSAPRLVDYPPKDPCAPKKKKGSRSSRRKGSNDLGGGGADETEEEDLGVTVEAQFEVEEYEIVILSAKESNGLETWLGREGYAIPEGSAPFYTPYIERGMYFFVVRVNLEKLASIALPKDPKGFQMLRPLQFEFESEMFMLPIQLGKINAADEQHLVLYVISPDGRYKVSNYRNVDIPTNLHVDTAFKQQPEAFQVLYKDLLKSAATRAEEEAVLTEYVWKISSCDPCPTQPPTAQELAELGARVFVRTRKRRGGRTRQPKGTIVFNNPSDEAADAAQHNYYDYVVTRFRASYPPDGFAKDLTFEQDTAGSVRFQGRYIMQFPFTGETPCLEPDARIDLVKAFKLAPASDEERAALASVKHDPAIWAEAWVGSGAVPPAAGETGQVEPPATKTRKDLSDKAAAAALGGDGQGAAASAQGGGAGAASAPADAAASGSGGGGGGGGGSQKGSPSALCSMSPRGSSPSPWPVRGAALFAACALALARRKRG